jgi:hypothetical protein
MGSDWFNPSINLKPHYHRIFRRHLFETFTELFVVFYVSLKTSQIDEISEMIIIQNLFEATFPVGTSATQAKRRENDLERPLRR